ncbi:Alpha/Beta hydrolase protein [Paraphoma chrysanthemicola]|uniref:Alpha/Beta hydrolase protein n=1 Tax=Paraphoma chrysanthemicola TaxID=798071 RepID=A0A8K0QXK4_9PLEO|nr:Alpha/Beta hydrolase protein [Paraphoma chrysanthemicola]
MPRYSSSIDGADLFYRQYHPTSSPTPYRLDTSAENKTRTLVLLHQWPLSSRMYDPILFQLSESHRYPCIAPDRRGFGNSDWGNAVAKGGVSYDVLAQDIVDLLETTKPGPFVFVAASMGTGEALLAYSKSAYIREHCQGMIWISTSLPYPVQSPDFPDALPRGAWDATLDAIRKDRSSFIEAIIRGPIGVGAAHTVSDKTVEQFERIFFQSDPIAVERCLQVFTSVDLSEKIREFGQTFRHPFLLIHGSADGGVSAASSVDLVKKLAPKAEVRLYEEGGHILILAYTDKLLSDIVQFMNALDG